MKIRNEEKILVRNKNPKYIIIFLHGYGSNGADLISLSPYFANHFDDISYYSPYAPMEMDYHSGFQWFPLENRKEDYLYEGVKNVTPALYEYMEEKLSENNLTADRLFLVGFSQGAMLSMHAALRYQKKIAGVIAYSGALIKPTSLRNDLVNSVPMLLVHGTLDEVVPFESMDIAKKTFEDLDIPVEAVGEKKLPHSIGPLGIESAINFIKRCRDDE